MKDSNTDFLICDCGNDSFYDFSVDGTATCPKCGKEVEINGKGVKTELNKYMKDIEKALNKQAPKKLHVTYACCDEGPIYLCPNCGAFETYTTALSPFNETIRFNYCANCGQRLDWEVDLEELNE